MQYYNLGYDIKVVAQSNCIEAAFVGFCTIFALKDFCTEIPICLSLSIYTVLYSLLYL